MLDQLNVIGYYLTTERKEHANVINRVTTFSYIASTNRPSHLCVLCRNMLNRTVSRSSGEFI